jgi:hypothetical protein
MTEKELRPFIGKPCWFDGDTFEVRKRSDATLKAVENGEVVLAHFLGHETRVPISEISSIRRKDL